MALAMGDEGVPQQGKSFVDGRGGPRGGPLSSCLRALVWAVVWALGLGRGLGLFLGLGSGPEPERAIDRWGGGLK